MKALPRLTRRGLLMAAAGLSLICSGAVSGFTDLVRAGIFALTLVALYYAALLVFGRTDGAARVRRAGPTSPMRAGDEALIDLDVHVPARLRALNTAVEEPHTFVGAIPRQDVTGGRTHIGYQVLAPHRGVFTSGPARLEIQDPFGLVRRVSEIPRETEWLVWPRVHEVNNARSLTPGQGDESLPTSVAGHHGEIGASTRTYVRGDDMRLVHWPATAHRGELTIRQFDPPADDVINLLLVGEGGAPGTDESWESLIEEIASLWASLHAERRPVTLTIGDEVTSGRDDGLDALARVLTAAPAEGATHDNATWAFVHTSCRALPQTPRHARSIAVIAGPDEPSLSALEERLSHAGWSVRSIPSTASGRRGATAQNTSRGDLA